MQSDKSKTTIRRPKSVAQEGAEAFRAGVKHADNPYAGFTDRGAWTLGWVDAAVDAGVYTRDESNV